MARESLFGVDVVDGTSVKWGTVGTIAIGTPIYVIARGSVQSVQILFNGANHFVSDLIGWYGSVTSIGFDYLTRGWYNSTFEAITSIDQYGVFAFVVSVAVVTITMLILFMGVSNVISRI